MTTCIQHAKAHNEINWFKPGLAKKPSSERSLRTFSERGARHKCTRGETRANAGRDTSERRTTFDKKYRDCDVKIREERIRNELHDKSKLVCKAVLLIDYMEDCATMKQTIFKSRSYPLLPISTDVRRGT